MSTTLALVTLLSLAAAPPQGTLDPPAAASDVVRRFVAAVDSADLPSLLDTLGEHCVMWYPWKPEPARSRADIEAEFRSQWARRPAGAAAIGIVVSEVTPVTLSRDVVVVTSVRSSVKPAWLARGAPR